MKSAEIRSWQSSGMDYSDGLIILRKYSTRTALVRMLESGEDKFNRQKLEDELQEILDSEPQEKPTKIEPENNVQPELESSPEVAPFPTKLLRLIGERKVLYAKVNHLHSHSKMYEEGEGLKELVFEILATWDRIDEIWSIQDYFAEHGRMPADAAEIMEEQYNDPIFLKQRQSNLRSSISKIPGKLKKAEGNEKKTKELTDRKAKYEKELKLVDEKLDQYKSQ